MGTWTYQDFLELPDDGNRYEILDGFLVCEPPPQTLHQVVVMNVSFLLKRFVDEHQLGIVLASPVGVILSDMNVVEPDVLFVARDRLDIIHDDAIRGAPDLAVEVLSPSSQSRDRVKKRDVYERLGVQEYWIVDPGLRLVEVYRHREAGLEMEGRYAKGPLSPSPLLPGLLLDARDVFHNPLRH